ncbi:autotransporter outer membrane beta-barrel domain-containing protein [Pseudomonas fitomaticsae]|uniref:Autotransporter outer membrane beta-barrel domain-containing protein n=1 Tax=Pseudomonas fitomaticsae TaxID=2837969 RepID=A0ABY3PUI3_9PSED|nr:autotransporter outer membrane beta-barrel domain-containing protein [Pseudomonas fitomaticsae]UFP97527.1 autotransporter outer membrane beta-barrel domain-containing protein [Pseudomonas fitomaticsae]
MASHIGSTDVPVFHKDKLCLVALSLVITSFAEARPIIVDEAISNGAPVEDFIVGQGATLTVNDATTLNISTNAAQLLVNTGTLQDIRANNGSTVTLDKATVIARANQPGVTITNSTATINNSTITSDGAGLQVARVPNSPLTTVVSLTGTTVTGGTAGAVVSAQTTLNMSNSDLVSQSSTGYGLRLASGDVFAKGGRLEGGLNGILLSGDNFISRANTLVLDGTKVIGGSGAAISVDPSGRPIATNIHILNGASLTGGNGNLLEVGNGGTVNLTADNAVLKGDVVVARGATTNISLQNASALTGDLNNVAVISLNNQSSLKGNVVGGVAGGSSVLIDNGSAIDGNIVDSSRVDISNGSRWTMAGNNQLNILHLNGGNVVLGSGGDFKKLDIVNLSGNGLFDIRADFAADKSDFFNVTGTATGNHQLRVAASGTEFATGNTVKVGSVNTGDAAFSLYNGRPVDAGTFTYKLLSENGGVYLAPDKEVVSTGTNAALAIAGTAPTILYSEMTTLNSRLGDRRLSGSEPNILTRATGESPSGVWIRSYANQYNVANAYGDGFSQKQRGISVGGDTPFPFGDGQWLIGGFGGYSKTDMDLKWGSTAAIESYYAGGSLTWYDARSGYYVDTVSKINQFDNSAKITMSDGTRTKGHYKNLAVSGSVEVGKYVAFDNGIFIEPFTQITAAVAQGKDYTLDNGMRVSNDHARSFVGKVGTSVGSQIRLDRGGELQPRLKVALAHEFIKNNEVSVNGTDFANDLSSTNVELGAGINWVPARKSWQVYSEVSSSKGKTVSQEWGASVGLSYSF